jgi:hypothetical protein
MLNCMGSADCHASCQASVQADASCHGTANLVVEGDAKLYAAMNAHIGDIEDAFAATFALKDPIAALAGKTVATFQALGDIGVSGAACIGSSLTLAAQASASINVSVSASASIQGKAG